MAIIVVALGGNALQHEGNASTAEQKAVACETAVKLAAIVSQGHQLIIVHGNGPQVGNILLAQHAIESTEIPALSLDTCVAMTQGSIGYWLQQALNDEFQKQNLNKQAVSIITQMVVNKDDPKFLSPDKPIGPFYDSKAEAMNAADGQAYTFHEDSGRGWRRVVPSPAPVAIVETDAIKALINAGMIPIVAGGGGIPVIKQTDNSHQGVEAVIDKDSSAALIAELLGADQFIILTAVSTVMLGFGTPEEIALERVSSDDMTRYIDDGQFGAGSMLPKVQAAQQFVNHSGNNAVIGKLNAIEAIMAGQAGTVITP